ncbi:unnamed protein product [Parnassius apollo]|uniref:(apollo) hypothetical protein n=1 Tax=Parnassius apollo TaxID=110799 RepID=A0A8S3Y869_PARAO|nr:unnamed protein product [Parnassius apollo]
MPSVSKVLYYVNFWTFLLLGKRVDSWEERIKELEQNFTASHSPDVTLMQENNELRADLENLRAKFDDLDQASRSCNVELQNIPDKKAENLIHLSIEVGSQLRAPAEVTFHMSSDEEDDVPLSSLSKRRRTMDLTLEDSDAVPSCNSDVSTNSTFVQPTVPRNQTYRWKNRHIPNHFNQWNDEQSPKNLQSPLYYFDCLFNNNVIELLVRYTNLYAGQRNKVGKVTVSEMKCFLGNLMYSGYVVVPRRFMYWETSTDADFRIVHNAMSRDRFTFIMSNLHCCDNTVLGDSPDKFAKLRPLFDELNKIFTEIAPLEKNYSIDEAMVPYYGRHSCKQFIRGKPIRWGYKLWVDATRLGYVIWFDPYRGKSSTIVEGYKQFGLGGSVILEFTDVLQGRDPTLPFHLFFDNYFSSIPLLHEISNRGLRATGTIRENRTTKCPLESNKDFKNTDRGSFVFKSSLPTNILVCKWNDNSVVTVASNTETVEPLQKVTRFSQELKKICTY